MRAFQAAKNVSDKELIDRTTGKAYGDEYITFCEFRTFLVALRQYFEYYQAFSKIDEDGDRRLTLEEFKAQKEQIEIWVGPVEDMEAEFNIIDDNGGGIILFDEFCEWALAKKLDLEDDIELTDEAITTSTLIPKPTALTKENNELQNPKPESAKPQEKLSVKKKSSKLKRANSLEEIGNGFARKRTQSVTASASQKPRAGPKKLTKSKSVIPGTSSDVNKILDKQQSEIAKLKRQLHQREQEILKLKEAATKWDKIKKYVGKL